MKSHTGRILNIDDEGVWIAVQGGYIVFSELKKEEGIFDISKLRIGQFVDGYTRAQRI